MDIAGRCVVLAFEEKIEICRADDVEGNCAELLMGITRLGVPNEEDLMKTFDQPCPVELMFISEMPSSTLEGA